MAPAALGVLPRPRPHRAPALRRVSRARRRGPCPRPRAAGARARRQGARRRALAGVLSRVGPTAASRDPGRRSQGRNSTFTVPSSFCGRSCTPEERPPAAGGGWRSPPRRAVGVVAHERQDVVDPTAHVRLAHAQLHLLVEQHQHRQWIGRAPYTPDDGDVPPRRTMSMAVRRAASRSMPAPSSSAWPATGSGSSPSDSCGHLADRATPWASMPTASITASGAAPVGALPDDGGEVVDGSQQIDRCRRRGPWPGRVARAPASTPITCGAAVQRDPGRHVADGPGPRTSRRPPPSGPRRTRRPARRWAARRRGTRSGRRAGPRGP